jgi:hypothetical protein
MFCLYTVNSKSLGSVVGIATGYGLADRGAGVRASVGKTFSILHIIQTGSGVHTTFYRMGTDGALSPGVKWQGCEADHLPLTSAEVKKT